MNYHDAVTNLKETRHEFCILTVYEPALHLPDSKQMARHLFFYRAKPLPSSTHFFSLLQFKCIYPRQYISFLYLLSPSTQPSLDKQVKKQQVSSMPRATRAEFSAEQRDANTKGRSTYHGQAPDGNMRRSRQK